MFIPPKEENKLPCILMFCNRDHYLNWDRYKDKTLKSLCIKRIIENLRDTTTTDKEIENSIRGLEQYIPSELVEQILNEFRDPYKLNSSNESHPPDVEKL